MKIFCITHADFETPGVIEDWARNKHFDFIIRKPYQGESCLNNEDFDFLIIMGGPQSPCETEKAPYLKDEITLIQKAIEQNKIILGFCLGAQLIGEAFGAKTLKSPEKEIGVYPVTLTPTGIDDSLLKDFPASFPVIHWHNDMPGLSPQAEILAYSEGCPHQIIKYGTHIYGFQCHLEITLEGMEGMIAACPSDLKPSLFTQTEHTLMSHNYDAINKKMIQILDKLSTPMLINNIHERIV